MALGARVVLRSLNGEREVPLAEFYTGVRSTVLQPDEMLVDIVFPALVANQHGTFIKFALRRAQAISLVNVAVVLTLAEDGVVSQAQVTLGSVAPKIVHAQETESFLTGKVISAEVIDKAASLAVRASRPISDVRGSAGYRQRMVKVTTARALRALAAGSERESMPENPVLLRSPNGHGSVNGLGPKGLSPTGLVSLNEGFHHDEATPIITQINGQEFILNSGQNKSLLRLLREDAGLIGSKEGCAEGECGSCTVFLNGQAVMSCMVPAPRAHGAEIYTVEGLATDGHLHPVQAAFVSEGAVQCGYCIPGFLMSAAKLLEERPTPTQDEIRQAITGNLCRCTGYYKIIEAVETAAKSMKEMSYEQ
jgi:carbon-monoxide dehydrogenase medium subunit